jgi:capsular polysaccharide transport system permease protein
MSNLLRGMEVQIRVISALFLREMGSRHGGGGGAAFWILFEPIFITLIVIGIHEFSGLQIIQSVPVVIFLLTGYVPHLMFRHSGLAGIGALAANGGLLYHRQIHYSDLVLARWGVEAAAVIVAFCILYFVFWMLGILTPPREIGYIYLGWFFHIWFTLIICFIFTGSSVVWPIVRRLFMPFSLLMLAPYGAFFMLAWLPEPERNFLLWFPCADATEIMRYGYFGASEPTYFNIPYTIESCIVLTVVSMLILAWGARRLEV